MSAEAVEHAEEAASRNLMGPTLHAVGQNASETVVHGLTFDGRRLWQTYLPPTNGNIVPDGYGGLLVTMYNGCDRERRMKIVDLESVTGDWIWEAEGASACTADQPHLRRPDLTPPLRSGAARSPTSPGVKAPGS